jgi:hypothetical protein
MELGDNQPDWGYGLFSIIFIIGIAGCLYMIFK